MGNLEIVGQVFERLTILKEVGKDRNRKLTVLCSCSCGVEKMVRYDSLRRGDTKSCGCLQKEVVSVRASKQFKTHGKNTRNSPEYRSWNRMIERCGNSNDTRYEDYGGRGIKVCERWKSFENFFEDMGLKPSKDHSIDRIDVNGNYCLENCKWATRIEQQTNMRSNHYLEFNGEVLAISEWARKLDITYGTLFARINRGWSVEKAFTVPIKKKTCSVAIK